MATVATSSDIVGGKGLSPGGFEPLWEGNWHCRLESPAKAQRREVSTSQFETTTEIAFLDTR